MPLAAKPATLFLSQTKCEFRGAELLALLAFPEPDKLDDRALAAFRLSYRSAPPEFSWVQTAAGGVMPIDRRRAEGGAKRLEERLQRRLLAGKVAAQAVHTFETGEPMAYLQGGRWTIDAALRQQASDVAWRASTNLHKRVWVSSTPVIHIAAAWVRAILFETKRTGSSPDVFALTRQSAFYDLVVAEAVRLEVVVPACPELRVGAADMIKLR